MADKLVATVVATPPSVSQISTAGASSVGSIALFFDEDQPVVYVIDMLEKAKIVILDYYANKA